MSRLKRLTITLLTALAIVIGVFVASRAMIRALPGDPFETLLAESGTSLPPEELKQELGLDRSFVPALAQDFSRALRGDLGRSLLSREPIRPLLAQRFLNTALLTFVTLALGLTAALALGLSACAGVGAQPTRLARFADPVCTWMGAIAASLPAPWLGPVLAYVLSVKAGLFPIHAHLALPAITLAISFSGLWARLIRSRVRETLARGAAPGARARGIRESTVLWKYGLAPSAAPLAAYLGTQLGALLAGVFVTEAIFDWPGMGGLLVDAISRRDYPVVEAAVFASAVACLAANGAGEWMRRALSPQERV